MNSASFLNRHRRARVRFTPKAGDPWMPVTSTGMTEESFDRLTGITPPAGTRSWHNLTIGRATVDRLLDRYDWYEPYLPPERLAAASYADVWKLEDIAVELIVEYADRFWRSQRRMWEH